MGSAGSGSRDSGAGLAFCPGQRTTRIAIVGNIDSADVVPWTAWDPQDPTNTANFSTTATIYDDTGEGRVLDVYFRMTADRVWDYHALVLFENGTKEYGNGRLEFDYLGRLQRVIQITELRIPSQDESIGTPIALHFGHTLASGGTGTDGMTNYAMPSNISHQAADGSPRKVGYPCQVASDAEFVAPPPDAGPTVSTAHLDLDLLCDSRASTKLRFEGAISTAIGSPSMPWTAKPADGCNYAFTARLRNTANYTADYEVHLHSIGPRRWSYHLVLQAMQPSKDSAAAGTLEFDDAGQLAQAQPSLPLRFPEPDGSMGPEVTLDFAAVVLLPEDTVISLDSLLYDGQGDDQSAEPHPWCRESWQL
jgi:hypothetical protein